MPNHINAPIRQPASNRRINAMAVHQALIAQALSQWEQERIYLSLDTTIVWNCFCIVWVGVVYRGRTIPVAWKVVAQAISTVRLWTIQRVLQQAARLMPTDVAVVLLADRGFANGKLMRTRCRNSVPARELSVKYLRENLGWHFRIRIKRSFQFQLEGQWHRGMSYLKIGWNWIRLAITHQWHIQVEPFLPSLSDPQPAMASKRQQERVFQREFTVLKRIPTS